MLLGTPPQRSLLGRQLNIKMLDLCNAACSFCGYNKERLGEKIRQGFKPYTLDVDAVLKRLPDLKRKGIGILHLTGGEPTLHPRFVEFVREARQQGFSVRTGTNGSLLDEARVDAIIAAGVDYLWYSLDTFPYAAHLEHRGFTSRGVVMERGLRALVERGVNVFGQTVLSRVIPNNEKGRPNLEGHVAYYRKTFGLKRFVFSYPMHRPDDAHHHLATEGGASVDFSREELLVLLRDVLRLKSQSRESHIVNPYLGLMQQIRLLEGRATGMPCLAGRELFFLGPDEATLRPCYHLSERVVDVLDGTPLKPAEDLRACNACSDQCYRDPSLAYAALNATREALKPLWRDPALAEYAVKDMCDVMRTRGYRRVA